MSSSILSSKASCASFSYTSSSGQILLQYLYIQVQSETESSSSDENVLNSATEISTDSEFDQDPVIRETPKIFIDDTHIRRPTKVQIKSIVIDNVATSVQPKLSTVTNTQATTTALQIALSHQEFKPLIQVDPSLLNSNRIPLKNLRAGDYLLNKTASTEGIASKKSLELKKRYLLGGEDILGNKIMKSGSTSILDSKLKKFHSNISECQKLLNPAAGISFSMKTFLNRTKFVNPTEKIDNVLHEDVLNKSNEKNVPFIKSEEKLIQLAKENNFVINRNEINMEDIKKQQNESKKNIIETNNIPSRIIETIDLISPEKKASIVDSSGCDISYILNNNTIIETIDLTTESLDENEQCSVNKTKIPHHIFEDKEKIVNDGKLIMIPTEKIDNDDCQETSIEVPNISWIKTYQKQNECDNAETDSLTSASSSTSSLNDIPHYILDSTTSPDTQNGFNLMSNSSTVEPIVPRLEIHDSSGTLMQIDSLMIIDGQYIGDPEDLKLMEIPEGMTTNSSQSFHNKGSESENTKNKKQKDTVNKNSENFPKKNLNNSSSSKNDQKNELKFDSRNENKVESLKALPLILEESNKKLAINRLIKPTTLEIKESVASAIVYPLKNIDNEKTPIVDQKIMTSFTENPISDSETEITGQVMTETELSDWTADDVVSENFVDIEFVLNSNKGTVRRNKKGLKKKSLISNNNFSNSEINQSTKRIFTLASFETPTKQCSGIFENLAIEEIDFMDTGSEGSFAEAYSATNCALIQNHGYIEFIENDAVTPTSISPYHQNNKIPESKFCYNPVSNIYNSNKEIEGIDYIEQGACILGSISKNQETDFKTPVNETVSSIFAIEKPIKQQKCAVTDNINEIDDDSLAMITSQGTANTTTEESDCLTVVTSPLGSASPRAQDNFGVISSDSSFKQLKENMISGRSSVSLNKQTSVSNAVDQSSVKKKLFQDDPQTNLHKRKDSDEINYEEYVRKLQQKINQISHARDSIDIKKHKRKASRAESIGSGGELISIDKNLGVLINNGNQNLTPLSLDNQSFIEQSEELKYTKVPDILSLSSKLEKITKERTKQKDLIHDLVMDKLQSKKQMNAEKRLNRNRSRNLISLNNSSTGSTNTTEKYSNGLLPSSKSPSSKICRESDKQRNADKENIDLKESNTPEDSVDVTNLLTENPSTPETVSYNLSDNLGKDSINFDEQNIPSKLNEHFKNNLIDALIDSKETLSTAKNSTRKFDGITVTEKLRSEARARAGLKSNQDLGISPEEKLKMLRKRYHLDLQSFLVSSQKAPKHICGTDADLKARQKKMTTSKSVNDINQHPTFLYNTVNSDENYNMMSNKNAKSSNYLNLEFTSDPNLINSSILCTKNCDNKIVTKINKRKKDPELRKSLIQTVSSFFNKGSNNKKEKDSQTSLHKDFGNNVLVIDKCSSQISIEQLGSKCGNQHTVFGRFKISPKFKDKSKHRDEVTVVGTDGKICHEKYHFDYSSSPQLLKSFESDSEGVNDEDCDEPPPIPPLPLNYQKSDDENLANESRDFRKQRVLSKASRQAELKRIRIAQEIQREQEEIEVQLKEYEARGVLIEKTLRGEGQNINMLEMTSMDASDEKLLKELLEIWRNITQLKKRDEELGIKQQELKLEHRHAQLKDELNIRLSCGKVDKSSADVAAEGAILNEMLEIVAKRAALRPNENSSPYTSDITTVISNKLAINSQQTSSNNNASKI